MRLFVKYIQYKKKVSETRQRLVIIAYAIKKKYKHSLIPGTKRCSHLLRNLLSLVTTLEVLHLAFPSGYNNSQT